MFVNMSDKAKEWAKDTDFSKIPEKVRKKKKKKKPSKKKADLILHLSSIYCKAAEFKAEQP